MPEILKTYLYVALGSALGGMGRFWISGLVAQRVGETFQWGTLCVNVTGSLLIGLIAGLADPTRGFLISPNARNFLMLGLCGGYTTFSSFSLHTLNLIREREWLYAGANVLLSVVFCLIAVWLGYLIGEVLNR